MFDVFQISVDTDLPLLQCVVCCTRAFRRTKCSSPHYARPTVSATDPYPSLWRRAVAFQSRESRGWINSEPQTQRCSPPRDPSRMACRRLLPVHQGLAAPMSHQSTCAPDLLFCIFSIIFSCMGQYRHVVTVRVLRFHTRSISVQ